MKFIMSQSVGPHRGVWSALSRTRNSFITHTSMSARRALRALLFLVWYGAAIDSSGAWRAPSQANGRRPRVAGISEIRGRWHGSRTTSS